MAGLFAAGKDDDASCRLLDHAVSVFGATSLDVNEQNLQAVGFYRHMGFEIVGRSELDGAGKPYPLLHMRRSGLVADVSACAVSST
jgi:ribosomal protein S18 acetylase RimI-like enzyme